MFGEGEKGGFDRAVDICSVGLLLMLGDEPVWACEQC